MAKSNARPGVVIVAAVLLMIFSGLKLIGACLGFAAPFLTGALEKMVPQQPGMMNQAEVQKELEKEVPGFVAMQYVAPSVSLVFGLTGLLAGIGLLRLRPAARTLAQTLCLLIILENWAEKAYEVIFIVGPTTRLVQKQMDQAMKGAPGAKMPDFFNDMMACGIGGGVLLSIVFNLALYLSIFFMLQSKTSRAAFAGKLAPEPPDDALEEDRPRSRHAGYEDDDDMPPSPPQTGITERPPS